MSAQPTTKWLLQVADNYGLSVSEVKKIYYDDCEGDTHLCLKMLKNFYTKNREGECELWDT